jgi:hypothetical protein
MNRRYCFVPYPPSECMMVHLSYQSLESVRKNIDGTECCVAYEGEKCGCLSAYEDHSQEEANLRMSDGSYGKKFPNV